MGKPYVIVGYDKDNDVYVEYQRTDSLKYAIALARNLMKLLETGSLKRQCSDGSYEPIDWLEIINVYKPEQILWKSYED